MKRTLMKCLSPGLLFMSFFASLDAARAGGMEGGGGDTYAIQFIQIAASVHAALAQAGSELDVSINLATFRKAIDDTQVESVEHPLFLEGAAKDAINYPAKKLILISRKSWRSLTVDQKRRLAVHEYMGILRLDDSKYQLSGQLLSLKATSFNSCEADESKFKADMRKTFESWGHPVCRFLSGNGTPTLNGVYLWTLHGISVDENGDIINLQVTAECNPVTGKFDRLQSSAGQSFLPPITKLPADFCTLK